MKRYELAAYKAVARMVDGEWQLTKEILDREEGPIVQQKQVESRNVSVSVELAKLTPAERAKRIKAIEKRQAEIYGELSEREADG